MKSQKLPKIKAFRACFSLLSD